MKNSVLNPLLERDPELVRRLAEFRLQVDNMFLDKLAGQMLHDATFRIKECPHPTGEVKATAILLRILTKESWEADDLKLLDLCWREATASELFGMEFEAERLRLQHCIKAAKMAIGCNEMVP